MVTICINYIGSMTGWAPMTVAVRSVTGPASIIRHESSPVDAAKIVVRHLRERVTIATLPNLSYEVTDIWLRQITDETGFEVIYVAALRSVGVPARLNSNHKAEFWDGIKWQVAPELSVLGW